MPSSAVCDAQKAKNKTFTFRVSLFQVIEERIIRSERCSGERFVGVVTSLGLGADLKLIEASTGLAAGRWRKRRSVGKE